MVDSMFTTWETKLYGSEGSQMVPARSSVKAMQTWER